jgi:hypothetical protein
MSAGFHLMHATLGQCPTGAELQACIADLVRRGVADDGTRSPGTARGFCLQGYRLAPSPDEDIVLHLGAAGSGETPSCP